MATGNYKARKAACDWAIDIANDNTFHYGRTSWAHHSGCYFCGTNGKGSAKHKAGGSLSAILKTYCCNPFVTAAYNHGAGAPSIDCKKPSKRINLANDKNKPLQNTKEWKKVKKPNKVTDLMIGDILLTPTHAMLYVGDGKIAHAKHHDNGVKGKYWNESICVEKIPTKQWKRTTKIYRYIGNGKFKDDIDPKVSFYVNGKYTLLSDRPVRTGHSKNSNFVKESKWTADALKHKAKKGYLKKGTKITAKEIWVNSKTGSVWVKSPTGWICAIGSKGTLFMK